MKEEEPEQLVNHHSSNIISSLSSSSEFINESHNMSHGWIFTTFMVAYYFGAQIFRYIIEKGYIVEHILIYNFIIAIITILTAGITLNYTCILWCFIIFEITCGFYNSTIGLLRSKYIPSNVRTTMMNYYRIPLNIIVIFILINIVNYTNMTIFTLCALLILISLISLILLKSLIIKKNK